MNLAWWIRSTRRRRCGSLWSSLLTYFEKSLEKTSSYAKEPLLVSFCVIFEVTSLFIIKPLDKFLQTENLPKADWRVHGNKIIEVVYGFGCLNAWIRRRWLHPGPIGLFHMSSIGGKSLQENSCWDHSKVAMVLGIQNGVRSERLRDVLVKIGGKRKIRIQVKHQAALIRLVDEKYVVVPNDQLLLVFARFLTPEWYHLLFVWNENHKAFLQFRWRWIPSDMIRDHPNVFLTKAGCVRTIQSWRHNWRDVFVSWHVTWHWKPAPCWGGGTMGLCLLRWLLFLKGRAYTAMMRVSRSRGPRGSRPWCGWHRTISRWGGLSNRSHDVFVCVIWESWKWAIRGLNHFKIMLKQTQPTQPEIRGWLL